MVNISLLEFNIQSKVKGEKVIKGEAKNTNALSGFTNFGLRRSIAMSEKKITIYREFCRKPKIRELNPYYQFSNFDFQPSPFD